MSGVTNGAWRDGAWRDGAWRDGAWRDGAWRDGAWRDEVVLAVFFLSAIQGVNLLEPVRVSGQSVPQRKFGAKIVLDRYPREDLSDVPHVGADLIECDCKFTMGWLGGRPSGEWFWSRDVLTTAQRDPFPSRSFRKPPGLNPFPPDGFRKPPGLNPFPSRSFRKPPGLNPFPPDGFRERCAADLLI